MDTDKVGEVNEKEREDSSNIDIESVYKINNDNKNLKEKVNTYEIKINELTDLLSKKDTEITKLQRLLLENLSKESKSDEPKVSTFAELYHKAIEENLKKVKE